jgi:NADH-quinone oxidoreductase subunit K
MMATVPVAHGLLLAGLLFALGVLGLLVRRNVVFVLLSLEIMLNAAGLAFIAAGARWGQADGQVMFILVLTTAAAELAVGLSLALRFRRHFKSLDPGVAGTMRG